MKKISLKNAENALSRNEMKIIMAGRRIATLDCGEPCDTDTFCSTNNNCPCCNDGKCGA